MIDETLKEYICQDCGSPFTSKGYHVFYCQPCRAKKRKEIAAAAHKKFYTPKVSVHVCPVCGTTFKAPAKQEFCSLECVSKALNEGLSTPKKDVEIITVRARANSRLVLEEARLKLGAKSINQLIKNAIVSYLSEEIKDDEELIKKLAIFDTNYSTSDEDK